MNANSELLDDLHDLMQEQSREPDAKRWEPRFAVAGLLTPLAVMLSVWLLFIGAFGLDLAKHLGIFVWCVLGLLWLAVFTFPWGLGAKK